MDPTLTNPFANLTFIVAPAILTNASAIMGMQTGTRFTLALNRIHALVSEITQLEAQGNTAHAANRRQTLSIVREQAALLTRATMAFNLALGAFACATFVSLIGAVLSETELRALLTPFLILSFVAGALAVFCLVIGGGLLAWETRYVLKKLIDNNAWIESDGTPTR